MPVGDVNSNEKGSGARYNDDKTDWSLLPMHLLEGTVRVWMYGAKKYAAWNWAKGMAWTVPYACALRHLYAWYRGEENDPESGQSHLDHVICNILMLKHFTESYHEGDDRPLEYFEEEVCEVRGEAEEDSTHDKYSQESFGAYTQESLEEFPDKIALWAARQTDPST